MIKKHWWKILLLTPVVVVLGFGVFIFRAMHMSFNSIDADNPPRFIQHDVVADLSQIAMISRFRSGAGHDFSSGSGESCRSMKHYYTTVQVSGLRPKHEVPDPVEGKDLTVLSPVDGRLDRIERGERKLDDEIVIVAKSQPSIKIRLMHVTPLSGVKKGAISAGQPIGTAGLSFDVVLERLVFPSFKQQYISVFAAMPDHIFASYQSQGIESRDELIVSRAARDAQPIQCKPGTEEFAQPQASDLGRDYVILR